MFFLNDLIPYQIVDIVIALMSHLTSVDMSDDNWASASQGIVTFLGTSSGEKLISRILVDLSNMVDHLNKTHMWNEILYLLNDALEEDGLLTYLLLGLEKDPDISWEEIMSDADRFLRSDIMMQYGEGSFWRDVFHLVDFMSDAFDTSIQ